MDDHRDTFRTYVRSSEPDALSPIWAKPEVKASGDSLLYRHSSLVDPVPDRRTLREKVLLGFVALENATNQEILEYARQWGVLGLCLHGRPCYHEIMSSWVDGLTPEGTLTKHFDEGNCGKPISETEWGWSVEPFAKWRDYAGQLGALMRLAMICTNAVPTTIDRLTGEYSNSRPGDPKDWAKAMRDWQIDNPGMDLTSNEPLLNGRWTLSNLMSHWMRVNNIRPVVRWGRGRATIHLTCGLHTISSLLPVLAVQTLLVTTNSVDMGLCAGCTEPFLLGRGQSTYRNSYCAECRKRRVPQKKATQAYYHRQRQSPNRKKRTMLNDAQAQSIKRSLKNKRRGVVEELAAKYGVSKWTIYKISQGKSWCSTKNGL
jgi:hypothetical protein